MDKRRSHFTTLCRLCLQPGDELTDIFTDISSSYQFPKISLSEKIMDCVSIKISPTDHGPHKICNKCLNSVNSWFEFNEECKIANAVLQKFLSELSMKTKANEPIIERKHSNENSLLDEITQLNYDSVLDKNINFGPNVSSILYYCFAPNQSETVKDSSFTTSSDFSIVAESQTQCSYTCNALSPIDLSMQGEDINPEILWRNEISIGNKTYLNVNGENFQSDIHEQLKKSEILSQSKSDINLNGCHSTINTEGSFKNHDTSNENKLNMNLNNSNLQIDVHQQLENENNDIQNQNKTNLNLPSQSYIGESNQTDTTTGISNEKFHNNMNTNLSRITSDSIIEGNVDSSNKSEITGYVCELCNCKFSRFVDLQNHDDRNHETLVRNHSCLICKRLFISAKRLKMHQDTHREKTHKCSTCNKLFASRKSLIVHNRLHTGRYKCLACEYVTTSKLYLKHHLLKHEGKKLQFVCQICSKTFSNKSSLLRHANTHLKHRGKVYKCPKCNAFSRTPGELSDHMNTHSDFKNLFSCHMCRKLFKSKRSLQAHVIRHKEAKFVCKVCDKKLYSKYELRDHEGVHTNTKAFRCFHCDKYFSFRNALIKHLQKNYPRIRSDIMIE